MDYWVCCQIDYVPYFVPPAAQGRETKVSKKRVDSSEVEVKRCINPSYVHYISPKRPRNGFETDSGREIDSLRSPESYGWMRRSDLAFFLSRWIA